MFSTKTNINILTELLRVKGIEHAVVCPGSRNAPIVHNLSQIFTCTPVTDERSAGFYALGMAQATRKPVVVCVTSGSALLNLAPAVAEAFYQHVPVIIVAADRPARWIDRLDGQTLPQPDALGRFVKCSVCLPEDADDEEQHNHCNLLVNQALIAATGSVPGPVLINVPLSEPLFDFTLKKIPHERNISTIRPPLYDSRSITPVLKRMAKAERPMIVLGQAYFGSLQPDVELALNALRSRLVVISEKLSDSLSMPFDAAIPTTDAEIESLAPDFVLTLGGTLVSKRLKKFLRKCQPKEIWEINAENWPHDTFMHQTGLIMANAESVIYALYQHVSRNSCNTSCSYLSAWEHRLNTVAVQSLKATLPFSQAYAIREFEASLYAENMFDTYHLHYANSSAVRLGNLFSHKRIWCNRGVNGIEGSLSTAAGFSLTTQEPVYCIIGDLSFFYDQNALWNDQLGGNFHILLLNNGCGGIFHQLPGLNKKKDSFPYIAGNHHCTAENACQQSGIDYLSAHNEKELSQALDTFLNHTALRPMLLEVFTDAAQDAAAMSHIEAAIDKQFKG